MSIAMILLPPNFPRDPGGINEWSFHHANHHLIAVQKLRTRGVMVPVWQLDPFNPDDFTGWAERHQRAHNDANAALGTQGVDLETVDPRDELAMRAWFYLNFQEHVNWDITLQLGA